MSQGNSDPLRFLNIGKKRMSNKLRFESKNSINKQLTYSQASQFILPSFSSQNSLENDNASKFKKVYNPTKYFNPEIQEFLNKLQRSQIANQPVMPAMTFAPNNQQNQKQSLNFAKTFKVAPTQTLPKNTGFEAIIKSNNEAKTLFNFLKPELKKSGSMKMMEILQEKGHVSPQVNTSNPGISPWQLPENLEENQELWQCEVCSRKFNPKSYEKHVKVCEKVFFQKRKPFNSRSNSLEKKSVV